MEDQTELKVAQPMPFEGGFHKILLANLKKRNKDKSSTVISKKKSRIFLHFAFDLRAAVDSTIGPSLNIWFFYPVLPNSGIFLKL